MFSKGRLILSHVRNRLSVDTTRALMCLGNWITQNQVPDDILKTVSKLPDVKDSDIAEEDEFDAVL